MATHDAQRQQLIQRAMATSAGDGAGAIQLWQSLATQLISIIGEGGFDTLYVRSLYLANAAFPWLAPGESHHYFTDAFPARGPGNTNTSGSADSRFAGLKNSLDGQSASEANQANSMLLLTLTDILASLIGEPLTIGILTSAWGDDVADTDSARKEFQND